MFGADQAGFLQCCLKKLQIDPGMVLMTKNLLSVSFYLCKHDLLSICNLYLVIMVNGHGLNTGQSGTT